MLFFWCTFYFFIVCEFLFAFHHPRWTFKHAHCSASEYGKIYKNKKQEFSTRKMTISCTTINLSVKKTFFLSFSTSFAKQFQQQKQQLLKNNEKLFIIHCFMFNCSSFFCWQNLKLKDSGKKRRRLMKS